LPKIEHYGPPTFGLAAPLPGSIEASCGKQSITLYLRHIYATFKLSLKFVTCTQD